MSTLYLLYLFLELFFQPLENGKTHGLKTKINEQIAICPIREEMSVVSRGDQLNQVS